ncbi:MAG: hypothetical protein LIO65_03745 [Odoribacter sp.]|nr:hypothetical protein [Odoribacter sp.]
MEEEIIKTDIKPKVTNSISPSPAYVTATWLVLMIGIVSYLVGLYNAEMELNEKGYYLTILLFGLFAVVALQKALGINWKEFELLIFSFLSVGLEQSLPFYF